MKSNLYPLLALVLISSCKNDAIPNLSGHIWEVVSINDYELKGALPWITFELEEGTVNGNAGCNNFFGGVEVNGTNLSFSSLGATRMMCEDMTNEDLFFNSVQETFKFKFENSELLFLDENEATLLRLRKN